MHESCCTYKNAGKYREAILSMQTAAGACEVEEEVGDGASFGGGGGGKIPTMESWLKKSGKTVREE